MNINGVDITLPNSLEYLTEWHARFGDEFPIDADNLTHFKAKAL